MHRDETLPVLRWPLAALLAIVAILPFLFVTVPPLTDVPGHIGRFAVQTAPAGSGVLRYFGFLLGANAQFGERLARAGAASAGGG